VGGEESENQGISRSAGARCGRVARRSSYGALCANFEAILGYFLGEFRTVCQSTKAVGSSRTLTEESGAAELLDGVRS
jgi:hypothetical protein